MARSVFLLRYNPRANMSIKVTFKDGISEPLEATTRYKRGDIILVPFPFTDLSSSKRRPALVISPESFNERMQDLVVVAITSQLLPETVSSPSIRRFNGSMRSGARAAKQQMGTGGGRTAEKLAEGATKRATS